MTSTAGKERYTYCNSCKKEFVGTRAFDDHRVGGLEPLERRCLTTFEMQQGGSFEDSRGRWSVRTEKLSDLL